MLTTIRTILIFTFSNLKNFFTECGDLPADIAFLLDGSGSEGNDNFRRQLQFATAVVNKFEVSTTTRFGMATFASEGNTEFTFTDYNSRPEVIAAIGIHISHLQ